MIYTTFANKDATIYENNKTLNTGVDEILELTKVISSSLQPGTTNTRFLIDFDLSEVSKSVATGLIPSGSEGNSNIPAKYILKIYNSSIDQVPYSYEIKANPISESWASGIGKTTYTPISEEGCSWTYRDGKTPGTLWNTQGGATYSGFECSQSFVNESTDIYMDITNIVSNSFDDLADTTHGILLQRSNTQEQDDKRYGSLKFFSTETHTIYQPRLYSMWDDSIYTTTGLTAVSQTEQLNITLDNLQEEYKKGSKVRVGFSARLLYPQRSYVTSSVDYSKSYVPETSYYSIIDGETGEVVIDYDSNYTKVSCDTNGNFFNLWMSSFIPERYYGINFKVIDRMYSGSVEYYSPTQMFKVTR
tara:strand:- start:959 stop:2041 length:1083 start_codon:yes stop_codon:yes gene_type:complete